MFLFLFILLVFTLCWGVGAILVLYFLRRKNFQREKKIEELRSINNNVTKELEKINRYFEMGVQEAMRDGKTIEDLMKDKLYLQRDVNDIAGRLEQTTEELNKYRDSFKKEQSRNKSVEVRTGQIMERLVPLLEVFGEDHENAHFMGNPIDYIVFNEDKVVFLEVKTGDASLSTKQRRIKKLIENKQVEFKLVRIKGAVDEPSN